MKLGRATPKGVFMACYYAGILQRSDVVAMFGAPVAAELENASIDARILLCAMVLQQYKGAPLGEEFGPRLKAYVDEHNTIGGPQ